MNGISEPPLDDGISEKVTDAVDYFATIEEHFRRARGTRSFWLSASDFALAKSWRDAGVPLQAVIRGIDRAFERWRARPTRARIEKVNSLAYCAHAIVAEARAIANVAPVRHAGPKVQFTIQDVREFITRNAAALRLAGYADFATSLETLDLGVLDWNLDQLEQHLISVEKDLIAKLRIAMSDTLRVEARCALEPYQGKMDANQLAALEKQFLERRLLESAGLPRLSLFYL